MNIWDITRKRGYKYMLNGYIVIVSGIFFLGTAVLSDKVYRWLFSLIGCIIFWLGIYLVTTGKSLCKVSSQKEEERVRRRFENAPIKAGQYVYHIKDGKVQRMKVYMVKSSDVYGRQYTAACDNEEIKFNDNQVGKIIFVAEEEEKR